MLSEIRKYREQRAKLVADAQALLPKDGQKMEPEIRQKFDALMDDAEAIKRDHIEPLERAHSADEDLNRSSKPPESQLGAPGAALTEGDDPDLHAQLVRRYTADGEDSLSTHERQMMAPFIDRDRRHRPAFRDYLRNGLQDMKAENRAILAEFRDMGVGTGNLGGYFVPQGFVYDIEQALKYYGNMLGVATIMDTATGQPLPYPTDNDTTVTGELVGEGVQVTNADVSIGHIVFGAFKFSTKLVKVSLELLQDSAFDMESYLKQKFAIRFVRILNTKFTLGAGTTEPFGIIVAATTTGPTAVGSSGNTGGTETGGTPSATYTSSSSSILSTRSTAAMQNS
jgi:HK97 family phage major capsid protein